jgi:hypothetical protein
MEVRWRRSKEAFSSEMPLSSCRDAGGRQAGGRGWREGVLLLLALLLALVIRAAGGGQVHQGAGGGASPPPAPGLQRGATRCAHFDLLLEMLRHTHATRHPPPHHTHRVVVQVVA